ATIAGSRTGWVTGDSSSRGFQAAPGRPGSSRTPKLRGSAPAPGAVFRARAENIGRSEISRTPVPVTRAKGWTRGASSHTRSVCASLRRDRAEA
ncbi:MAG: hypothetical protein ABSA45_10275, partial [Verrucomicrobiota bacterium]